MGITNIGMLGQEEMRQERMARGFEQDIEELKSPEFRKDEASLYAREGAEAAGEAAGAQSQAMISQIMQDPTLSNTQKLMAIEQIQTGVGDTMGAATAALQDNYRTKAEQKLSEDQDRVTQISQFQQQMNLAQMQTLIDFVGGGKGVAGAMGNILKLFAV